MDALRYIADTKDICNTCDGTGVRDGLSRAPCYDCDGKGLVPLCEPDDETPECMGGCGRECDHPEEVESNGSWTCQGCEEEQAREQIADARSGR